MKTLKNVTIELLTIFTLVGSELAGIYMGDYLYYSYYGHSLLQGETK